MTTRSKNNTEKDDDAVTADDAEIARQRSNLYGLLAAVYRAEPTSAMLKGIKIPAFQKALKAAGVVLEIGGAEKNLAEALAVEYTRLFLGPGKHIAPYAAIHLGGDGASLWGPETSWVKGFIEDAGFDYKPDYHDLPDHISVELEFMQEITAGEAAALEREDPGQAEKHQRIEVEFITAHMAKWVPGFCRQVQDQAELPFYKAMARLTEEFILSEAAAMKTG